MNGNADLEALLMHERWVRRLAGALVRDGDVADDVAQQARIALWRRPPRQPGSTRAWLGSVVRNLVRNHVRGVATQRAALDRQSEPPGVEAADAIVERLATHRQLAALVAELDEPFRSAIVLRYYEEQSAAEIARTLGVPAGTVRWRVKTALGRLRQRLDEQHEGDRRRWLIALAPFVRSRPSVVTVGALAAAACVAIGVGFAVRARNPLGRGPADARAASSSSMRSVGLPDDERTKHPGASALFGVVLPTLTASAAGAEPLAADEAIAACLRLKQHAITCSGQLADSYVIEVPLAVRERARARTLAEIQDEGSTSEAAFARCRTNVSYKTLPRSIASEIDDCVGADSCAAFVACARPILDRLTERAPITLDRAGLIAARVPPGGLQITADEAVVAALDRLVGSKGARRRVREGLARMRGEMEMVSEVFDAFGVPRELAALGLAESGFDRGARSPQSRSVGLWQFTAPTARRYGLVVGEGRDDRLDPRHSTEAAAALLADLNRTFGNWELAVAAYNQGEGAVRQAIAAGGTTDPAELQARGLLEPYRADVLAAVLVTRDPTLVE